MTGKFVQKGKTMFTSLTENLACNYEQGYWVHVKYDDERNLGEVQNFNCDENLVKIRCLKPRSDTRWKIEPEIDVV